MRMTPWASERRFIIMLVLGCIVGAFVLTIGIATFYQAPSCADNKQNQGENGIDCGGPCDFLCKEDVRVPTVLFTKALNNGEGRTDIVAMIENKNADAVVRNARYHLTLYGADQTVLREVKGTIDLPPQSAVPVFIPGMFARYDRGMRAFLDIEQDSLAWMSASKVTLPIVPTIATPRIAGTTEAPRVTADVSNPDTSPLSSVKLIAILYDEAGEVIAASSTVTPPLSPLGTATARFTWNGAFPSVPAVVTVLPMMSLR